VLLRRAILKAVNILTKTTASALPVHQESCFMMSVAMIEVDDEREEHFEGVG
jgi:hypothetical protein